MWKLQPPWKKYQPPYKSWGPVKPPPPFFENLVGGSTHQQKGKGGALYDWSDCSSLLLE